MTRRFFAPPENFQKSKIFLDAGQARHLREVLRLRIGAEVNVFDGCGREFSAVAEKISKNETVLEIVAEVSPSAPESPLDLTLAVALLKGEKFDLVVQKACELGVSKIIPLETRRADVKIKNVQEGEKKLERWRRVILESSKQSGRAKLMEIVSPISYEKLTAEKEEKVIFFSERGGREFEKFSSEFPVIEKITAVVGAEGGWEDSEIETAQKNDFHVVTLGGRILRAETAGIIVPALLQNHFGDLR